VWVARPVVVSEPCWLWFQCRRYEPGKFLGGDDPDGDCARSCAAIPFILPGRDAVIRRYLLKVPSTHDREIPSFSATIVAACAEGTRSADLAARCGAAHNRVAHSAAEQIIGYTASPWAAHTLRAGDVVALAGAGGGGWADGTLHGKIVLIGGTYPEARDSYETPLGERAGVEIVAEAIENQLEGGVSEAQQWVGYLADVAIGFAIAACVPFFSFRRVLLVAFVGIPVIGLIVSFLVFRRFGYWFNVVPIAFGVYLHELADHAREYVRLRDAVERAGASDLLGEEPHEGTVPAQAEQT
jgi:CHASE2 domain-containing sensor protein